MVMVNKQIYWPWRITHLSPQLI